MRKETLVFLTSLAIIFIIGYVNMSMAPENIFNDKDYAQIEANVEEDVAKVIDESAEGETSILEVLEQTDKTDISVSKSENEETVSENNDEADYEILGDITDIINGESVEASSENVTNNLNSSFANFKLNKEKGNMDVIDHLEKSLSNKDISAETKSQFESLLLNKNQFVQTEKNIELMLQSKGYNETVVIVDEEVVKVVTNDNIEQADATVILDVIVSETDYEPSQIKIVKFDNIDL